MILWSTNTYKSNRHYIIDDQHKICGSKQAINDIIKNEILLSAKWKKANLRVLDLNDKVYREYCEMRTWQNNKDERFNIMTCNEIMSRLKSMGNEVKNAKHCDKAAMTLYQAGARKWGHDDGLHASCQADELHNDLLAKLLHNISLIYFEKNKLESSCEYAKMALKIDPQYKKCAERVKIINETVDLID